MYVGLAQTYIPISQDYLYCYVTGHLSNCQATGPGLDQWSLTWSTWPNLAFPLAKSGPGVDTIIKQTNHPTRQFFKGGNLALLLSDCSEFQGRIYVLNSLDFLTWGCLCVIVALSDPFWSLSTCVFKTWIYPHMVSSC